MKLLPVNDYDLKKITDILQQSDGLLGQFFQSSGQSKQ